MLELILLFIVSFLAATLSGIAGFGGALVLLPFLIKIVGVQSAVPILTIGQLFGNASRVWFGRLDIKWKPVLIFLIAAIPFTVTGSYLFADVDGNKVKIGIGFFLLFIVVYRRLKLKFVYSTNMLLGGTITGFLSGLVGSAGPLGAAFFLELNLSASAYVASEAFTALFMHITKIFVYNKFALFGKEEILYGLFIGIAMIAGSWVGKKLIHKLSRDKFILIVEILLIISGFQFILN